MEWKSAFDEDEALPDTCYWVVNVGEVGLATRRGGRWWTCDRPTVYFAQVTAWAEVIPPVLPH